MASMRELWLKRALKGRRVYRNVALRLWPTDGRNPPVDGKTLVKRLQETTNWQAQFNSAFRVVDLRTGPPPAPRVTIFMVTAGVLIDHIELNSAFGPTLRSIVHKLAEAASVDEKWVFGTRSRGFVTFEYPFPENLFSRERHNALLRLIDDYTEHQRQHGNPGSWRIDFENGRLTRQVLPTKSEDHYEFLSAVATLLYW